MLATWQKGGFVVHKWDNRILPFYETFLNPLRFQQNAAYTAMLSGLVFARRNPLLVLGLHQVQNWGYVKVIFKCWSALPEPIFL